MKYFTKEWYTDLLISDMCFQLRKTESASTFSESYFKRLYLVEERAYLKHSKRRAKAKKAFFDKEAARAEFASNYHENLKFVNINLPEEILSNVQDVRVLALGSATHDVAMQITRFCGKKNRLCESIEKEYDNVSEETDEKLDRNVLNTLVNINGSVIKALEIKDSEISLSFCPADSQNEKTVKLIGASVVEDDRNSEQMTVIKHELLLSENGGVDLSLLLITESGSVHTVSFHVSQITAE